MQRLFEFLRTKEQERGRGESTEGAVRGGSTMVTEMCAIAVNNGRKVMIHGKMNL